MKNTIEKLLEIAEEAKKYKEFLAETSKLSEEDKASVTPPILSLFSCGDYEEVDYRSIGPVLLEKKITEFGNLSVAAAKEAEAIKLSEQLTPLVRDGLIAAAAKNSKKTAKKYAVAKIAAGKKKQREEELSHRKANKAMAEAQRAEAYARHKAEVSEKDAARKAKKASAEKPKAPEVFPVTPSTKARPRKEGAKAIRLKNNIDRQKNTLKVLALTVIVETNGFDVSVKGGITGIIPYNCHQLVDAFGNNNITECINDAHKNMRVLEHHDRLVFASLPNGTGGEGFEIYGYDPSGRVYAGKAGSGFVFCSDGKEYSLHPGIFVNSREPIAKDAVILRVYGSTTSQVRKKGLFMARVNGDDIKCPEEEFMKKHNTQMRGAAIQAAMKKFPFPVAAKLAMRHSLAMSPSSPIGKILEHGFRYAVYMGKLNIDGKQGFDGGALLAAKMLQKMFFETFGVYLTLSEVVEFALQFRTLGVGKGFAPAVMQHVIETAVDDICKYYKADIVEIENPTEEHNKALVDGKYKGKLVIVGKKGNPIGAVMDLNCIKSDIDLRLDAVVSMLDAAKPSKAHLNIQIAQGYAELPNLYEWLVKIGKADLTNLITDALSTDRKYPVNLKAVMSGYVEESLMQAAPSLAMRLHPTRAAALKNLAKSAANRIKELSFEVPGYFLRVVGDPGIIFGREATLKDNEVFSWKITSNTDVAISRNPKIGTQDHFLAKVVSWRTIKSRVRRMEISKESKLAILSYYKRLSKGAMVLPCTDEVKNLLGGLDFDFDGVTVITSTTESGKTFNELARLIKPQPVHIVGGDPSNKKKPDAVFGAELIEKMIIATIDSPNANIGVICNLASKLLEVANSDDKTLIAYLRAIGIGRGTKKYQFLTNWDIGVTEIKEYYKHLKECTFLKDDGTYDLDLVRKVFRADLVNIMVSVCGNTLDAIKEKMEVPVPLLEEDKMSKVQFHAALKHRTFEFVLDKNTWQFELVTKFDNEDPEKKQVFIESKLTQVQMQLAEWFCNELNSIPEPEAITQEEFDKMFLVVNDKRSQASIMNAHRLIYFDAMRLQAQKLRDNNRAAVHKDNDFQSFNEVRKISAKSVRALTQLAPEERGAIALYLSTVDKSRKLRDTFTTYYKCFADEVLAWAISQRGAQKYCGVEVYLKHNKGIGKYITFYDGISKHAVSVDGKINGKFRIAKYGDKVFAVRPIKDVIEERLAANAKDNTVILSVSKYTPESIGVNPGDMLYIDSVYSERKRSFFSSVNKVEDKAYGGVLLATPVVQEGHKYAANISLYDTFYSKAMDGKIVKIKTMYRSATEVFGKRFPVTLLECEMIAREGKVKTLFGTKGVSNPNTEEEILQLSPASAPESEQLTLSQTADIEAQMR